MKVSDTVEASHRGGVLIATLAYVAVVGMVIAGVLSLTVSHYSRSRTESDYSNALAVAEAGINYELNKISVTPTGADQSASPYTQSLLDNYAQGAGSFTVYVTPRTGTTVGSGNWTSPNDLFVFSTGTVNGISRTVRVGAKSYTGAGGAGPYALFGISQGILNGGVTINGNIGTDGGQGSPANTTYGQGLLMNGVINLTGNVTFNGPGSGWWAKNVSETINTVTNANPQIYDTVSAIALQQFPAATYPPGGLAYLATHNDNALATGIQNGLTMNPAITASDTVLINGAGSLKFVGKPGGANYYLTSLLLNGTPTISYDNSNGPITIWFGPAGGNGSLILNGGIATVKMSSDPSKAVKFYVAAASNPTINGTTEMDFGLYDWNGISNTGQVIFNGNNVINGSVISKNFIFNGTPTLNAVSGYFDSGSSIYFGAIDAWKEQGGAN